MSASCGKLAVDSEGTHKGESHHAAISSEIKMVEARIDSPVLRNLFSALLDESADFIYSKDAQFRYLSINAAAARAAGKPAEEIIGEDDFFIFPADEAQRVRDVDMAVFVEGETRIFEETCFLNGKIIHLSTTKSVVRDDDGNPVALLGVSRNITELRKSESLLRLAAAEERARRAEIAAIMEAAPAAIFIAHDRACRRMTGNRMLHELLEVPRNECVSKSAPLGKAPENFDVYLDGRKLNADELPVQYAAATGQSVKQFELEIVFRDGRRRWISGSALPLHDEEGSPSGAVGAFIDVSRYKEIQAQLQQANTEKERFFGVLGHELRNPLAVISNCLALNSRADTPEMRVTTHHVMERQISQMERLVDDLLDINRIANGKLQIQKAPINFDEVIKAALQACRPQIESMGRTLTVRAPSSLLTINGDFTRLVQVFINLLGNAAKFTPHDGSIDLCVEYTKSAIVVSVKDSGIGIAKSMLEKIFDSYVQVAYSAGNSKGGLGLGLSLVKSIIESHSGTVSALSDGPGTGAEFIVRLPR